MSLDVTNLPDGSSNMSKMAPTRPTVNGNNSREPDVYVYGSDPYDIQDWELAGQGQQDEEDSISPIDEDEEKKESSKLAKIRQKFTTSELMLILAVAGLFILIIVSVTVISLFATQALLEANIGDKFHFFQESRMLRIDYGDKNNRIEGVLGLTIPPSLLPYNCKTSMGLDLCQDWHDYATLKMTESDFGTTQCYDISWRGERMGGALMDCYTLSPAHWYGSGLMYEQTWPLDAMSRPMEAYVNGAVWRGELGGVLQRAWITSHAATITINADVPLFVSFNNTENPGQLCMMSQYTGLYKNFNVSSRPPWLDYRVCVSESMQHALSQMLTEFPRVACADEQDLPLVSWTTDNMAAGSLTQAHVTELVEQIRAHNLTGGRLTIGDDWESDRGDLTFDTARFPDPDAMAALVHASGLALSLGVHPYASVNSAAFHEGIDAGYWLRDGGPNDVPALISWDGDVSTVLDVSGAAAQGWFLSRLSALVSAYVLGGFSIRGGQLTSLPHSFTFENPGVAPVDFLEGYLDLVAQAAGRNSSQCRAGLALDVAVAANTQDFPAAIRLPPVENTWGGDNGLGSLVPRVLTAGLLGYPLTTSPPIEWSRAMEPAERQSFYLRWVQLAILFPVMEVNSAPWSYDSATLKAVQNLLEFRLAVILPKLLALLQDASQHGYPLWRPLWWTFSNDQESLVIDTEFFLGNNTLVAPLLNAENYRMIYIPPGIWRDENSQSVITGPTVLNYHVSLEIVPYFTLLNITTPADS